MKIKPDSNCAICHGTGETFDWVDYGSSKVQLPSLCPCIERQIPDDFDDRYGNIDLDLSDMLTPEMKKDYMECGGVICPWCSSENIERGHIETSPDGAIEDIHCNDCLKNWQDVYTLSDIVSDNEA